jgi:aspartyl-tRNA(Asn)/glutamyl-tRNA(Gln) amidotransferase subunit A
VHGKLPPPIEMPQAERMNSPSPEHLDTTLAGVVAALRRREISAIELLDSAQARHERYGKLLHAYRHIDWVGARKAAAAADRALAAGKAGPLCGIPVSVKDIYGVQGMPAYAGSDRKLPEDPWSRDGWLVRRVRAAGAVIVGKTHTVEFAYGGVGINPQWGTPRNPWDPTIARIPGGSSCGAGVSLWEGSALVALGSDTGGSIRIPSAFTGVVGHKTTKGRLPTSGVTQLGSTFDTLGALTRTVVDSAYFFGCVDPELGDPAAFLDALDKYSVQGLRIRIPRCRIRDACQSDIANVLHSALDELHAAGAQLQHSDGDLLDDACEHYMVGGIGKAEIHAWLTAELPGWIERLHPIVGSRITGALALDSAEYRDAIAHQRYLAAQAGTLFGDADVLALPANLVSPPPVAAVLDDLERYKEVNSATLRPTCPVNLLELCAISIPVGLDDAGMPVGLQLVARRGDDEALLGAALAVERVLGTPVQRLGLPPLLA